MMLVEHGSSIEYDPADSVAPVPLEHRLDGPENRLFGSARQALVTLAKLQVETSGVDRILLPDHYCHSTTHSIRTALANDAVIVKLYPATFGLDLKVAAGPRDLVVINAVFGVQPRWTVEGSGTCILDATHAPELALQQRPDSEGARFDYVIASLRKLLPLTDGGLLKATKGGGLPDPPSIDPEHDLLALELERLLTLKKHYVNGGAVRKADFYPRIQDISRFPHRGVDGCAISQTARRQLGRIDVVDAVTSARANVDVVRTILAEGIADRAVTAVSVLSSQTFVVLLCESQSMKSRLVERLIQRSIFPATLWPIAGMDGISSQTEDFVSRSFTLNADARYSREHMIRLAATVLSVVD